MVNAKHSIPIENEIARELKLSSVLDYDTTKGLQKIAINAEGLSKSFGGALQSFNLIAAYTNKGWDWPTLKPSLAYNINEQIQVGASFKADNKGLSNLWPQVLFRHEKLGPSTLMWLRADIRRRFCLLGFDWSIKPELKHAFEVVYGQDVDNYGRPTSILRTGLSYKLSDETSVGASANIAENITLKQQVSHKVSDNWRINANASFDSDDISKPSGPFSFKLEATY